VRGEETVPVALEKVAGRRKLLPSDHAWFQTARSVGTNLGE